MRGRRVSRAYLLSQALSLSPELPQLYSALQTCTLFPMRATLVAALSGLILVRSASPTHIPCLQNTTWGPIFSRERLTSDLLHRCPCRPFHFGFGRDCFRFCSSRYVSLPDLRPRIGRIADQWGRDCHSNPTSPRPYLRHSVCVCPGHR